MHKYGNIKALLFSKYANIICAQSKPNGKLLLLVDLRKINCLIADDYTSNKHPVSTLSEAAHHLAGKSLFCKLHCSQAITVCRWWTSGQWKRLHSILLVKTLPTKDLHKVSADLCLPFQVSCVSTRTQSLKLKKVLNTWTTLELQPTMLQILPRKSGRSSSAFARQSLKLAKKGDWNQTIWFPWMNDFTGKNLATSWENLQFSR